jgi:hypothetical protein
MYTVVESVWDETEGNSIFLSFMQNKQEKVTMNTLRESKSNPVIARAKLCPLSERERLLVVEKNTTTKLGCE